MSEFKVGDILRIIEPTRGMEHLKDRLIIVLKTKPGYVEFKPRNEKDMYFNINYTWYTRRFKLIKDPSELLKEFL